MKDFLQRHEKNIQEIRAYSTATGFLLFVIGLAIILNKATPWEVQAIGLPFLCAISPLAALGFVEAFSSVIGKINY